MVLLLSDHFTAQKDGFVSADLFSERSNELALKDTQH